MSATEIGWTDFSTNPWRARRAGSTATKGGYDSGVGHYCEKVSDGCKHCYASELQPKFGLPVFNEQRRAVVEVFFDASRLDEVLRRRKPTKWFWADMTDMFGYWTKFEEIAACFGVMAATPHHTHQVLTKRPERMLEFFGVDGIAMMVDRFKHIALAGRIAEYFSPERREPVKGFPGYFVTNKGTVLTSGGSATCLLCGVPNGDGSPKKKFCSHACVSKAGYERRMGRWTEPPTELRPMSPDVGEAGHSRVMLYREDGNTEKALVHRLVLEAFDRPSVTGEQGAHGDGEPTNNALWNLRWDSQQGNFADRHRHGTRRTHHKLTIHGVEEIRRRAGAGEAVVALAKEFSVSDTQIRNIVAGKQWAPEYSPEWPLRSVHLGVSCEDQQRADERIPLLLRCPAAVHWVSYEPALGPVDFTRWLHDGSDRRERGGSVSGGDGGMDRGPRGRIDLENRAATQEPLAWDRDGEGSGPASDRRPTERRGLPDGQDHGGRKADVVPGAPAGMADAQGADPAGHHDQSRGRGQGKQPSIESDAGDLFGSETSCKPDRPGVAGWRDEPVGEADRPGDRGDQGTVRDGDRDPATDLGLARSCTSDNLENRTGRAPSTTGRSDGGLHKSPSARDAGQERAGAVLIRQIIVGGESGAGYRHFDPAWADAVVTQCDAAGIACFVKQDSGAKPGRQGRLSAETWARKEFPAASGAVR